MKIITTIATVVCLHCTAAEQIDPRREIYNAITSGERAFLDKARRDSALLRDAMQSDSTMFTAGVPPEIHHLSKIRGISSKDLDQSELERTIVKANKGSTEAAYFLGLFYLYGLVDLEPNEEIAAKWFGKSADGGHKDARIALGLLFDSGYGNIKQNSQLAQEYFRLASREDEGNTFAHWLYAKSLFENASSFDFPEEKLDDQMQEAARLFELVSSDFPEAVHSLAIMYEYGIVKCDTDKSNFIKAAELYQSASQQGYVESTYHLGLLYLYGRGLPQNYQKATELFQIAATHPFRPHAQSMRYLAGLLAHGYADPNGVQYLDEALQWYDMCSLQTHAEVHKLCMKEKEMIANLIERAEGKLLAE